MRTLRSSTPALALMLALALVASLSLSSCSHKKAAPPIGGSTTLTVDGIVLNTIVRGQSANLAPLTVLFLHGSTYTSRDWFDLGLLDDVAGAGFRAVAIDLPGYGDTDGPAPKDRGRWLHDVVKALGGPSKLVIVSPSMSGTYSLAYLHEYPKEQLAGFVPVAPVGIDDFERPADAVDITSLAIWGSKDPSYTPARAAHLVEMMRSDPKHARTELIPGAGHACYEDHTPAFRELLLDFLDPTRTGGNGGSGPQGSGGG